MCYKQVISPRGLWPSPTLHVFLNTGDGGSDAWEDRTDVLFPVLTKPLLLSGY